MADLSKIRKNGTDYDLKDAAAREEIEKLKQNGTVSNIEPDEDDIPKVFFGSALPQTKNDTVTSFRYISKTEDISGYCKTKAQGDSSMNYPKKNQTVKLYKDADCTEKLKIDFKGWGKQNKFCFKANWIDLTHARNIVSARLWGDVVKSRTNHTEIPELLRTSPNQGAVDGFPVKVYANGIYQGRYTINIPKDAWMANMDDKLDAHCILCGENYVSGCFRAEANIDESDWTDEVHETVPESIKTRWNEVIRFVMNSTDDEFASGIGNYFDVESLIDYYLFGLLSCGLDAFGKNQLYMTYDGVKWYAAMYDMDSTWGLWWNGTSFVATDYARTDFQDFKDGEGNLLYIRLESLFADAIKARWEELKNAVLSIENIINRFERFTDIASAELVAEDYASTTGDGTFTTIPNQSTNNIQQIRSYAAERFVYADTVIQKLGVGDDTIIWRLANETTFDGVDDYIDTGIKLLSEVRTFTLFADFTSIENPVLSTVFSYLPEGLGCGQMAFVGAESVVVFAGNELGDSQPFIRISQNVRGKMAVRIDNGYVVDCYGIDENSGLQHWERNYTTGTAINSDKCGLRLGCGHNTDFTPWRYWKGTIHDFKVWNRVLSDEEMAELFEA